MRTQRRQAAGSSTTKRFCCDGKLAPKMHLAHAEHNAGGLRTGTSPRGPGCTHLAACMLLKHAVGDLLVALAAHTEALDVAVSCDAAPQQLQRAATSHAAVFHLLPCAQCTMHSKQHSSGKQSGWAARALLECRRSYCTACVLGDFTDTSPHCIGQIQSHLPDGSKTTQPVHTNPVPAQPCLMTATHANHALSPTPQAAKLHDPVPSTDTPVSAPHLSRLAILYAPLGAGVLVRASFTFSANP
jgi:hypothetical protein